MATSGSILARGRKGIAVGTATTGSAITSRRKRQLLEKSVPADIIVINERVQLDETNFKAEENTDRVGFTQKNGYFPEPMSQADLLNAKITFAKIFAKDSNFSLTDSKPPCDLEEYGVLRQGLENRFKHLRYEINKNNQIEGSSIKTNALLDQAVKIKAILDNMHENPCHEYSGAEFSIRSMTTINDEQMQRLIRNFSLMVLQAIHPIESQKEYFKADPVEMVKILDNLEVDNAAVEGYLNEYQKESEIPRLIGLILSESGPRDTVLGIMDADAKKNLYNRITQEFGKVFQKQHGGGHDGSNDYEALITILNDNDASYDDKIIRMIRFVIDMLGRYKVTNEELKAKEIEINNHKEMIMSRLSSLESEIAIYKGQRDTSDEKLKQLQLSAVTQKIGNQSDVSVVERDENQLQKLQDKIGELEIALGIAQSELKHFKDQAHPQVGGQRELEQNTTILKNVLNDITTTIGNSVKNYSDGQVSQNGGYEQEQAQIQAQLREINELKGTIESLKRDLASITVSTENDDIKAHLEDAVKKIKSVSENLASCNHLTEEQGKKYDRLLQKIELLAMKVKEGDNDKALQILDEDSSESVPLMKLYKTFQEKSNTVIQPVQTYNPCFLNYFIGFFIQKLFFLKGVPNNLYSDLVSKLQSYTSYNPLLDEMFAVLQIAKSIDVDENKSPELHKYLSTLNIDNDNAILSQFQKSFPEFYENVKKIQISYNITLGKKSISYLSLVAQYLVLARNYLVSTTLTGCSISKILTIDPNSNKVRASITSVDELLKP